MEEKKERLYKLQEKEKYYVFDIWMRRKNMFNSTEKEKHSL